MADLPRFLLVTGMSGAGKSSVLDTLEDWGWEVIDNLPLGMLRKFVSGAGFREKPVSLAVGMDVRSRGFNADRLVEKVRALEGVVPEILYIDCAGGELIRRYDETRRRHPLATDRPAEDGISLERSLTGPLRQAADSIIDTTDMKPADLRDELRRRYAGARDEPIITVGSFGFARGASRTADLMFDMRFIDNPHWIEELRPLTGLDAPVQAHVSSDPAWSKTLDTIEGLVLDLIPRYGAAGKNYLTVAFGCTGGRHRSVAAAAEMAERLRKSGLTVNVRHRDLTSAPSDTIESLPGDTGNDNLER
ncbi:RNase adapter RapZ [Sphingomicrobium flavum]|uniref:RNase adapter RapZ n=1 Tax=Sphingomicrobium flavum TaxID=1229164 RepID=UPI0021ADD4D6|nr:RNase adapter RapZ [Sphingomicrobium flavum]